MKICKHLFWVKLNKSQKISLVREVWDTKWTQLLWYLYECDPIWPEQSKIQQKKLVSLNLCENLFSSRMLHFTCPPPLQWFGHFKYKIYDCYAIHNNAFIFYILYFLLLPQEMLGSEITKSLSFFQFYYYFFFDKVLCVCARVQE